MSYLREETFTREQFSYPFEWMNEHLPYLTIKEAAESNHNGEIGLSYWTFLIDDPFIRLVVVEIEDGMGQGENRYRLAHIETHQGDRLIHTDGHLRVYSEWVIERPNTNSKRETGTYDRAYVEQLEENNRTLQKIRRGFMPLFEEVTREVKSQHDQAEFAKGLQLNLE